MKKLILAIALLILLSSCSSSMHAMREPEGDGFGVADADNTEPENAGIAETAENRKVIWSASVDIESPDASALHGRLTARAAELGGYEYTNDIQHQERYSIVRATYKVPPQGLQDFLAYAGEEGKVINRKLTSDDVTENYYDAQLRLESKRGSLAQYYRFMDETENLEDVLSLQRIIDGIIEDIEVFEGRLRAWDSMSDMATVSVYIRQENDPVKIQREINWSALSAEDMGYLVKSGFVAVSGGALTVLQWVAIALLVGSPLWVPALAVLFVLWRRRKKRQVTRETETPPLGFEE